MIRFLALGLATLTIGAAPAADWTARPHGPSYGERVPAMNATVSERLMPQLEVLTEALLRDRHAMRLDGIEVFKSGDKFLPGKIAAAMAYRITALPPGDPRLAKRLEDFKAIADLTVDEPNETWGIYYYTSALQTLAAHGLLTRAVSPATLAKLRAKLDWRKFVRPDLTLIGLPNNYYGVAFSVSRLRFLLGWEDASASDALLARTIGHYRKYSGEFGFADETDGDGRFDRYSVLLIGEIAQRLIETGMTPPPEVKAWLRKSIDLLLPRFNANGEGFEYGRSIGAYGETAFLEVLTAAARLKVLTPVEERMAYAFSSRIAARYMDFWINPATGSVDLWDQGRRTDAYRGKHRIFGENLSLARQHIYTNAIWNDLGYRGRAPDAGYGRWLAALPKVTTTWFAKGQYDRAVVTIRDGDHVIGLPIINGAAGQHMNNPYFPVPFSAGMLQGSADAAFPQLTPRITLSDGSVLMPLAWFRDVRVTSRGAVTEVSWRQDALDKLGADKPQLDARATIETRYRFSPGAVERSDRLVLAKGVSVARIDTEFAGFSQQPSNAGPGAVRFARGEVRQFATTGYGPCTAAAPTAVEYRAPTGPFATVVRCGRALAADAAAPITLNWTLKYDARPPVR